MIKIIVFRFYLLRFYQSADICCKYRNNMKPDNTNKINTAFSKLSGYVDNKILTSGRCLARFTEKKSLLHLRNEEKRRNVENLLLS